MIPFALPRRLVAVLAEETTLFASVIVGHRSVYPSQILGVAKTRSVRIPAGVDVGSLEDIRIRPSFRRLGLLLRAFRRAARGRAPDES